MWSTFSISEVEYIQLIRMAGERRGEDDKVTVSLILADDSVYGHTGKIVTAERAVDVETGTLQLVCEFPNPDGELRPGQFGRARLSVGVLKDAVLVPQKAVTERQGVKSVLLVEEGNKVAVRTIQVGERHEGQFVVKDGLEGGETIVVEGVQKAIPGTVVEPTEQAASAEPDPDGEDE
jgi:membrane fusion protein (multidrug efflux system)